MGRAADNREAIKARIAALGAGPGHAALHAAGRSYEEMLAGYEPGRINAVVLLTDGRNDDGHPGRRPAPAAELLTRLRAGSRGRRQPAGAGLHDRLRGGRRPRHAAPDRRGHQRRGLPGGRSPDHRRRVHRRDLQLLTLGRGIRPAATTVAARGSAQGPAAHAEGGEGHDLAPRHRGRPGPGRRWGSWRWVRWRRCPARSPAGLSAWPRRSPAAGATAAGSSRGLQQPWRGYVQRAQASEARFAAAVRRARPGPLPTGSAEIGERVTAGVGEGWEVARRGQALTEARRQVDVGRHRRASSGRPPGPATTRRRAEPARGRRRARTTDGRGAELAVGGGRRLEEVIAGPTPSCGCSTPAWPRRSTRAIELSAPAGDGVESAPAGRRRGRGRQRDGGPAPGARRDRRRLRRRGNRRAVTALRGERSEPSSTTTRAPARPAAMPAQPPGMTLREAARQPRGGR